MNLRTDQEIVDQTKQLASDFYKMMGYEQAPDYNWRDASHPQERLCWAMACHAQDLLTETDAEEALNECEG